jgi:hypothetical protein
MPASSGRRISSVLATIDRSDDSISIEIIANRIPAPCANKRVDPESVEVNEKMIFPTYTPDDLKKLPLRAIAAFAARCARRVEHRALLPDHHPDAESCRSAVSDAIQLAEDFARGLPCTSGESVIRKAEAARETARDELVRQDAIAAVVQAAYTAVTALDAIDVRADPGESHLLSPSTVPPPLSHLADVTADLAALNAYTAAVDASDATGHSDMFIKSAAGDYQKLLDLDLGNYPEGGKPIDPSPEGPLGPLQPQ